jgi:hypothetical protein
MFSIRPSSRRPFHKPKLIKSNGNTDSTMKIPFSNNENITVESGDSKNKIDQTKLGNVGNISTLAYLYCDLQNWGKTIIRQGNRSELDPTKPQIWVFCPLLKRRNPHDRILVENCKKCSHFKGMSEPITQKSNDITTNYKINFVPAKKHQPKIGFTEEQIAEAEKLHRKENREWIKEEREIFDKKQNS